jgi:minor histocompatibility antigen H13
LTADPPKYSILGLGDIVIPGIFVSLCLRFDFLKALNIEKAAELAEKERKGKGETNSFMKLITHTANSAPRTYFATVLVGYLIAIVTTVVIMIIYDHGQPALLYLVPGCLISVFSMALLRGEFTKLWEFNEDEYLLKNKDVKQD